MDASSCGGGYTILGFALRAAAELNTLGLPPSAFVSSPSALRASGYKNKITSVTKTKLYGLQKRLQKRTETQRDSELQKPTEIGYKSGYKSGYN